ESAAALLATAVQTPKTQAEVWGWHACLRLHLGDEDGYRLACAALLARYRYWLPIDHIAPGGVWPGTLVPVAVTDFNAALKMAEWETRKGKAGSASWQQRSAVGGILLRAGKTKEAIAALHDAVKLHGQGGSPSTLLFLALAHHDLGHADEACAWL